MIMNLRRFVDRSRKDQELADEIESHLAHERDANMARGQAAEAARRRANIRFGNARTTRERVWRYRSLPWIEDLLRDLRFARRDICKDTGIRDCCCAADRGCDRCEYGRLLSDGRCSAQAPHLSRPSGTCRTEKHQPTGFLPWSEHPKIEPVASADFDLSTSRRIRLRGLGDSTLRVGTTHSRCREFMSRRTISPCSALP